MQLIQCRLPVPNFGDDLNTLLWPALLPGAFEDDPATGFVGIGTIIGMPCGAVRRLHVFSAGIGNDPPGAWAGKDITWWCVRGPLSARWLGLPPDRALTDGAILAPGSAGLPAAATGAGGVAVIPHWHTLDHPGWPAAVAEAGFALVDPRAPPAAVIGRIAAAGLVLTESLHGAILADALGIPWVAFATSGNFAVTKWADWTLSVGCDLAVTALPPPDAGPLLRFGRPPAPFGETLRVDAEAALRLFDQRIAPRPPGLLARLKGLAKASPLARPLASAALRCHPARTAAALRRLARQAPTLSDPARRAALRDAMTERLAALRHALPAPG